MRKEIEFVAYALHVIIGKKKLLNQSHVCMSHKSLILDTTYKKQYIRLVVS